MISVIKWAWQAKPDTPAEKLVLVSLANSTFQTPREDIAVVGVRALRGTKSRGFITPLAADSEPVKWHIGALERERGEEGPWKAWRLNAKTEEKETVR